MMTNFTNMTTDQKRAALAWARDHDWGDTARFERAYDIDFLTISDRDPNDEFGGGHDKRFARGNDRLAFASLAALRSWAGY